MDPIDLQKIVAEKLTTVIDPETGVDVMRMRLVQDILVDKLESPRLSHLQCNTTCHPCSKFVRLERRCCLDKVGHSSVIAIRSHPGDSL